MASLCNYFERMWDDILDRPKHLMLDLHSHKVIFAKINPFPLSFFQMPYWKYLNPIIKLFHCLTLVSQKLCL